MSNEGSLENRCLSYRGPRVRIRLPPAGSQVRTRISARPVCARTNSLTVKLGSISSTRRATACASPGPARLHQGGGLHYLRIAKPRVCLCRAVSGGYHPGRGGRHDPFAIGRTGLSSAYRARPARILRTSVLGEIPIASAAALLLG